MELIFKLEARPKNLTLFMKKTKVLECETSDSSNSEASEKKDTMELVNDLVSWADVSCSIFKDPNEDKKIGSLEELTEDKKP